MSTLSKQARSQLREKAARLARTDPAVRVDASGYRPDGEMDAHVKTGLRPVSRQAYAAGGVAGGAASVNAGRAPRASGGRTLSANSLVNRDVKSANQEREGKKFDGGLKHGGRAHKLSGGPLSENTSSSTLPPTSVERAAGGRAGKMMGGMMSPRERMALQQRRSIPGAGLPRPPMRRARGGAAINDGTRPMGGRMARKGGGRTKKGTNVNIIIAQPPANAPVGMRPPMPVPPPPAMRPGMPPPLPQTTATAPGMGGPPPTGGLPMRASGGRTMKQTIPTAKLGSYPIESGAGGGKGRLEKARRAARA